MGPCAVAGDVGVVGEETVGVRGSPSGAPHLMAPCRPFQHLIAISIGRRGRKVTIPRIAGSRKGRDAGGGRRLACCERGGEGCVEEAGNPGGREALPFGNVSTPSEEESNPFLGLSWLSCFCFCCRMCLYEVSFCCRISVKE